jgi:hypothetical protein
LGQPVVRSYRLSFNKTHHCELAYGHGPKI